MTKTRLNQGHRQMLKSFAANNIACDAETKAREKAYVKAAKAVTDAVEKKYPPKDMAILQKYDTARHDSCIHGGCPEGRFITFRFDKGVEGPVTPRNGGCQSRPVPFSQATMDAITAYEKSVIGLAKAREAKLATYEKLIYSARYFEEIIDIWPAAIALSDRIYAPTTAVVALSDDVRAFIRNDNAGLQAQPA